jgi:hypothetical protein
MNDNDVKQVLAMKYIIRRFVALVIVAAAIAVPAILGTLSFIRDMGDNHNQVNSKSNPLSYEQVEPHIGVYMDGAVQTGGSISIKADVAVGTLLMYAGNEAPEGFLLCDGSAVSREEYKALYAAIGEKYGDGDGETTFNLPNMRTLLPLKDTDDFLADGGRAASPIANVATPIGAEPAFRKLSVPSEAEQNESIGGESAQSNGGGAEPRGEQNAEAENKRSKTPASIINYIIKY